MKRNFREWFSRFATGGLFIIVGACICWRAVYTTEVNMLGPIFCVIFAIMLAITGFAMILREADADQTPHAAAEID